MADAKYFILIYSFDLIEMICGRLFRDLKFIETKLHILHEENIYCIIQTVQFHWLKEL